MLTVEDDDLTLPGLAIEPLSAATAEAKFDLTLYVREMSSGIRLNLVYNTDLFNHDRMVEFLGQYEYLLQQIVDNPDRPIADFSLVTPQTKVLLPDPTTPLGDAWAGAVHAQVASHAHERPDHPAVIDQFGRWTYRQLEQQANQLAHYLRAKGIQPGDVVAVYGHRSAGLVWAWLGILKAGAAFVNLDPAYPVDRLRYYLDVSDPKGLLQVEAAGPLPDELVPYGDQLSCHLTLPHQAQPIAN